MNTVGSSRKRMNRKTILGKRKVGKKVQIQRAILQTMRALLVLTLVVVGGITIQKLGQVLERSAYIRLEDIQFQGCHRVTATELRALAKIRPGDNVLTVSLGQLAERLRSNAWIQTVQIERIWPHALRVKVEERSPVALVNDKRLFFVDMEGVVFKEATSKDDLDLPVITGVSVTGPGRDFIKKALSLIDIVDQKGGIPRSLISEVHLDDVFGFTIYTVQEGMAIRMGFGEYKQKLALLASLRKDFLERKLGPQAIYLISGDTAHVKLASSL